MKDKARVQKFNLYEGPAQFDDQWYTQAKEQLKVEANMNFGMACKFVKLVLDLPNMERRNELVLKKRSEADIQKHFRDLLRDLAKLV